MKVSVLVPVYGVEKYVERCAVSLMEQTHQDVEYVFVDDCSPDRSMEVLQSVVGRYPQHLSQVKMVRHEVNSGLGAARLTGLKHATGDAVMFVDSDDYLDLQAIERLVEKMAESGADIVDGAYCEFSDQTAMAPVLPYHGSTEAYLKTMLCHNVVSHQIWGRLYRRELFTERQVFPVAGINYSEDFHVVARLLLHARRTFTDRVVYYYNVGNNASYTHNISERELQSLRRAYELVVSYFREHDTSGRYRTALRIGLLNVKREELRRTAGHSVRTFFWNTLYLVCKRVYVTYVSLRNASTLPR